METETDTEIEYGGAYTVDTAITGVTEDPVFGEYGRLIFPVDSGYYSRRYPGRSASDLVQQYDPKNRCHSQLSEGTCSSRGYGIL